MRRRASCGFGAVSISPFQTAQQPAHETGVETERIADRSDVHLPLADRIQHPRRAQRTPAPEKGRIESTDSGRDGPVEATDAGDRIRHHNI